MNGVFQGGTIDSVQLDNGNLHLEVPIWSAKGRGSDVGFKYVYDSRAWQISGSCDEFGNCNDSVGLLPNANGQFWGVLGSSGAGAGSGPGSAVGFVDFDLLGDMCSGNAYVTFQNFRLYDTNNTVHHFVPNEVYPPNDPCGVNSPTTLYADDGSSWMLKVDSTGQVAPIVYSKDGFKGGGNSSIIEDSNGNQVNWGNLNTTGGSGSDTLGRVIYSDGSYFDSSGTRRYLQVGWTNLPVQTSLCQWDPNPGTCSEYSNTWRVISSVTLPNGLTYTINYVQNSFGQPSSIMLPSGGQISYTWTTGDTGGPIVATRTVSASGTSGTWTYHYWTNIGNPAHVAKVTDPAGNDTTLAVDTVNNQITQMQYYAGTSTSGTLLKTVKTDYSTNVLYILPIRVTTTWNQQNLVSKTETDWDDGTIQLGLTVHFSWGNPVAVREYDWGIGSPGPLMRSTSYNYLHLQNSIYKNVNIADKVTSKSVYDGPGTLQAQTIISYDGSSLTPTSGVPNHDYTNFSSSNLVRGNRTTVSGWLKSTNTWLSTTNTFDDLGNLRSTTDRLGNTTTYDYTDNFTDGVNRNAQAFATKTPLAVTNGINHIERKQFYWYTSLVAATCGQNFPSASACANSYSPPQSDYATFTYDLMNRQSTATRGDGGSTSFSYNEATLPLSTTVTISATPSPSVITKTVFDGLGRTLQTQLLSDPEGVDYVDKTYDTLGRLSTVSNPYRSTSDSTYGITTTQYDALSRVIKVIAPDGTPSVNNVSTSYSANCTTVTDEAGKSLKSCVDALGRLTQVLEDPSGLNYETDYTYDVFDNVLTANQKGGTTDSTKWRTRTFVYDSLSRLTSSTNPESNTQPVSPFALVPTTYVYNANGNLLTKTAPAPNQTGTATVTTTYTHDALNRLTQKSFSDSTPTVKYGYDAIAPTGCTLPTLTIGNGIGRRTGMCDAAGAEAWSYDITANVGWKVTDARTTNNVPKSTIVQNNLAGSLATLTYPSSRVITYAYDAAARPISAIDSSGPINYATAATYTPPGGLASVTNGASAVSTLFYNNRLQALPHLGQK